MALSVLDEAADGVYAHLTRRTIEDVPHIVPGSGDLEADTSRAMAALPRRMGGLGLWKLGMVAPYAYTDAVAHSMAYAVVCDEPRTEFGDTTVTAWLPRTLTRLSSLLKQDPLNMMDDDHDGAGGTAQARSYVVSSLATLVLTKQNDDIWRDILWAQRANSYSSFHIQKTKAHNS